MIEFYTIKDRALHLVNDSSNPKSIRAFQTAGELQDIEPEIVITSDGANVNLK